MPMKVVVPAQEFWDETAQEFRNCKEYKFVIEHSLISVQAWESKWHKFFIRDEKMTPEELKSYVKCMTITQNIPDEAYDFLTPDIYEKIIEYIDDPMTATTFKARPGDEAKAKNRERPSAELIYYWMFSYGIPYDCRKWHLNQLMTLIKIFAVKQEKPEKMTPKQRSDLNKARRAAHHSRG